MAPRIFFITLVCQIALSCGIQQGAMSTAKNKRSRLMRRKNRVVILPDGQTLEPRDHEHADGVASRSGGMGSSQIEVGPEGKLSLQSEGQSAKRIAVMSQELVDPTSKDHDDESEMHPDEDPTTLGLSEEDAEKVHERRALTKVQEMVQVLDLANETDHAEASRLEHELINGVKGANVMEDIIDMQDSVRPGAEVDNLLKSGAVMTTEDFVALERYESGNPNIQDLEEVGENGSGEGESKDEIEDENSTLAQAAMAGDPIRALLPLRPGDDLMRLLEHMLTPSQMARLQELNKTHHFFLGVKAKGPNRRRAQQFTKTNGKYKIKYCRGSSLSNRAWDKFKQATRDLYGACQSLDFQEVNAGSGCKLVVKGDDNGCWAGGSKINLFDKGLLSLKGTCASKGIAIHEILHILGQAHEQSRTDRDGYVTVHFGNIVPKYKSQFHKRREESTLESYDLGSIMQYGCRAWSKNSFKYTLEAHRRRSFFDGLFGHWDCLVQMGQRSGMTSMDTRQLQRTYGCKPASRPSCRRRWFRCR